MGLSCVRVELGQIHRLLPSDINWNSSGEDFHNCPDQSQIAVPLIENLLANASGKDANSKHLITPKDLSQTLSQRRADAKATNPEFTTSFTHRMFGSSKYVFPVHVKFSILPIVLLFTVLRRC